MERKSMKTMPSLLLCSLVAAVLSQSLLIPVMSSNTFDDQKNYYSHDPHTGGSPPTGTLSLSLSKFLLFVLLLTD